MWNAKTAGMFPILPSFCNVVVVFPINDYRFCFRGINLVEYDTTAYQYQESGRSYQGKIFYFTFCTHLRISPEYGIALLNMDI